MINKNFNVTICYFFILICIFISIKLISIIKCKDKLKIKNNEKKEQIINIMECISTYEKGFCSICGDGKIKKLDKEKF